MEELKVYYDRLGNTLTVWFGDPAEGHVCEVTGEEVVLMKDREGKVIGFEKLNFSHAGSKDLRLVFQEIRS